MDRYVRSFSSPDERIELEALRSELVSLGGLTVSHDVYEPGWRWSDHVKPVVGTELCEVPHTLVILRGRFGIRLRDGTTFEAGALSLVDIPAGHDAWVLGDEPTEIITWSGAKGFLAPLESLNERILSTIVFTDIVDSTGTALRLGDRLWSDVLATHEARTREVLGRFRGQEVKMTGDGVLAIFDGAARAVRCAVALREMAADTGISLRAAVHTGEIESVGGDVRGLAVHEAARMLGLATAQEILVSATTASLASEAGVRYEDAGEHELRGIEGARRLFRVA